MPINKLCVEEFYSEYSVSLLNKIQGWLKFEGRGLLKSYLYLSGMGLNIKSFQETGTKSV